MKKCKGGGGSRKKPPNAGVRQMAANLQAGIENAKNKSGLKEAATEAAKAQQTAAAATATVAFRQIETTVLTQPASF
jgi:phosphoenolpyruvate synthase/pyruvate phosphate dikinase